MGVTLPSVPPWRALRDCRRAGATPEEVAEIVVQWASVTVPVRVERIATQMGVVIHPVAGVAWAGAVNSTERAAAIWVRSTDARVRRRFTIAHELGHLMLHDLGVAVRDDTFSGNVLETQANRFAVHLLMPPGLLRIYGVSAFAHLTSEQVGALARLFDVPEQAMKFRVTKLGAHVVA